MEGLITILIVINTVFFALAVFFFIKWILLKKQFDKPNVEEEIISMVDEGSKKGVLEDSEAEMIHNIFEFGDKQAQDIMTNRSNISAIDALSSIAEAKEMMLKLPYSRYPVFINDLDHIIGVLHLKDMVRYTDHEIDESDMIKNHKNLLRRAFFIPETKDVDDLFKEMQSAGIQMAVVVDEYGQTSGIIALEDILEEIVGNITDEYDIKAEMIGRKKDGTYEMAGLTPLEDIEEVLGIEIQTDEYETLNGFMTFHLNHIPTAEDIGFVYHFEGYSFEILSVLKHVIDKVKVVKDTGTGETPEEHTPEE